MQRAVKAYDRGLRAIHSEFEDEINRIKDKENDKLDNISSAFESGHTVDQINESIEMLNTILGKADEIITNLDDILSEAGISSDYKEVARRTKIIPEKKVPVSMHCSPQAFSSASRKSRSTQA